MQGEMAVSSAIQEGSRRDGLLLEVPTILAYERARFGGAALIKIQGLVRLTGMRELLSNLVIADRVLVDLRQGVMLMTTDDWFALAEPGAHHEPNLPIGFLVRAEDAEGIEAYRDAMLLRRRRRYFFTSTELEMALAWVGLPESLAA